MLLFALGLSGLTTTSVALATSKTKRRKNKPFIVIESNDGK
jgi:hypothetical protein